jgi:hypothetical protein
MADILRKTANGTLDLALGFLSTAVFLAAFIVAGDILIAAVAALFTVLAQVVVRKSTHRRTGFLIWASLAIVLALTGLSVSGEDASAAAPGVTRAVATCACPASVRTLEARLAARPAL